MEIARLALILLAGVLAAGCAIAAGSRPSDPGGIGAIITYIDAPDGYMVVEWAGGRTLITMDQRALGHYRVGDDVAPAGARPPLPRPYPAGGASAAGTLPPMV